MIESPRSEPTSSGGHWEAVYRDRGPSGVSWFQSTPAVSLELIDGLGLGAGDAVLDVGAGASTLLDALLERGHRDVTALDVSPAALAAARWRAPVAAAIADGRAHILAVDLLGWTPPRRYTCWHDREVFHFLTDPVDRARYRSVAVDTVVTGGYLVVGTLAGDGPSSCSGLATARNTPERREPGTRTHRPRAPTCHASARDVDQRL